MEMPALYKFRLCRWFHNKAACTTTHARPTPLCETRSMGWQRPTLPHRYQCSTIGSCGLNFRVRDGTGCTPTDLATNTHSSISSKDWYCVRLLTSPSTSISSALHVPLRSLLTRLELFMPRASGSLHHPSVHSSLSQSTISIGSLHTSLRFHVRPIQLVVS